MAQLVARLVRNEKVGGSNPPSSTTGRHPIADVVFLYVRARWCGAWLLCCSWRRWCSGRSVVMLCGALPLCVPVGGGPPAVTGPGCLWLHGCSGRRRARPPARLGVLTSFGAAPRSPPVPSGPSGALHTCGAGSLFGSSTRRLVVRPGLATARWHRSQAPQALHPALAHIAAGRTRNVACNSPATCSSHEIITLELQRFQTLLKLHPIELHAFFGGKNLPPPSALRLGSVKSCGVV